MEYSTTQQRIAAIGHQPVLKKSTFVFALAIFGVFSILAGIISLASAITLSRGTIRTGQPCGPTQSMSLVWLP